MNLSPEGLRHSNKSPQGWSKQPFPALSSSEHRTTAEGLVLTSPLGGGAVGSCAGNRAPEKIQCITQTHVSDLWLSQPGSGVLVLLTDKLDPAIRSVVVELKKK